MTICRLPVGPAFIRLDDVKGKHHMSFLIESILLYAFVSQTLTLCRRQTKAVISHRKPCSGRAENRRMLMPLLPVAISQWRPLSVQCRERNAETLGGYFCTNSYPTTIRLVHQVWVRKNLIVHATLPYSARDLSSDPIEVRTDTSWLAFAFDGGSRTSHIGKRPGGPRGAYSSRTYPRGIGLVRI